MARAWVGIGSNLGDRFGYVRKALGMMRRLPRTEVAAVSSVYDTAPVGREGQPRFLNAVAELRTELTPRELLNELLAIEDRCGRVRRERWGSRSLDLDLLVYDDVRLSNDELTVPHPRIAERAFVLVPLAEIAPDLVVPGGGGSVDELLRRLGDVSRDVKRVGEAPTPPEDA